MSNLQDTQTYAPGQHPDMPPPLATRGIIGWMRKNLFSSIGNTILTLVAIAILWRIVPPILDYFVFDAVINASNREECVAKGTGACWAVISERFQVSLYAFYPEAERWRLKLTFLLLFVALGPVLFDRFPLRKQMIWFSLAYPFIAIWLVVGGFLGLPLVETKMFGGVMLTLIIGITGITFSLPLGILLALGRISNLPAMQIVSVAFIEFIRGVPLITLLFVASTMLNYFLPPGTEFDLLLRVLIMVTLFASAYIAEVVRGGLQAIPKGQYEAADAMGLKYWQAMRLIILPQALKISIPGIVNTFIGLYKDTTLVLIIGLFDVLGIMRSALADPKWNGLSTEVYIYTALFFFVSCFAMSRYSLYLEKKLHTGHKR
ncbi:amino acid ABC transporter permease [Limibacillus halophilus]|uniref:General L-amino acid transport system permease protein n=1 Tax=Limibacillus halophilus TaxID=1579333 RepID=A0A839ST60_9PROT|nr:amino acid ABC transporter permease [Limibacillus halophilus]MBB3065508.1 general L-amino acid transport system permease protein [Limibacillus halophilus]